jgi:hypothetical protein
MAANDGVRTISCPCRTRWDTLGAQAQHLQRDNRASPVRRTLPQGTRKVQQIRTKNLIEQNKNKRLVKISLST